MPDHLHLLLKGESAASAFLPFMKLMRQRTALFYRRLTGDRLWQDGYFDRVLRLDDDIQAIVEYMMTNPVRAGLVKNPEDYPFAFRQGKAPKTSAQLLLRALLSMSAFYFSTRIFPCSSESSVSFSSRALAAARRRPPASRTRVKRLAAMSKATK